jgi:hypothetical protein
VAGTLNVRSEHIMKTKRPDNLGAHYRRIRLTVFLTVYAAQIALHPLYLLAFPSLFW